VDAALQQAKAAKAGEYAPESLRAAEDAKARMDSELKAQEDRFALFRSYEKSKQIAAEAKAAAAKAAEDGKAGEAQARTDASTAISALRAKIDEVKLLLESAPKGKGTAADLAALKGDVDSIELSIGEIQSAFDSGRYKDARARAEAATQSASEVAMEVQAAIDAVKAAKGGRR
jgi:hypothetical protein